MSDSALGPRQIARNRPPKVTSIILAGQAEFLKKLVLPNRSQAIAKARELLGVASLNPGEREVLDSADAVIGAELHAVRSYVALCIDIRKHQLSPKQVTAILAAVGYNSSRIAEVKRVAFIADEIWDQFMQLGMSFKACLARARQSPAPSGLGRPSAGTLNADVSTSALAPVGEHEESSVGSSPQPTFADAAPVKRDSFLTAAGFAGDALTALPEPIRRLFENKAFLKKFTKELGGRCHAVSGAYRIIVLPAAY